jgi:hypothetical protein
MRLFNLIALLAVFSPLFTTAQSIDRWVIGANGTSGTAGAYALDFTVGEVAVETVEQGTLTLNQGFHQTKLEGAVGIEPTGITVDYTLYPNPTSGQVILDLNSEEEVNLLIELVDALGKSTSLKPRAVDFHGNTTVQFDLTRLAAGHYFVVISDLNSNDLKSLRVIRE